MNLRLIVLILGAGLPGAILWMAPAFRRETMLFGVRVAPGWITSPRARRIVTIYRLQVAAWVVIEIVLALRHFFLGGALLLTVGAGGAFAIASRATRPYGRPATPLRSASLRPDDSGSVAETVAALFPLLLLALTAVWMHFHWDRIPERFPVHFDLQGHANRWSNRTWRGVYGPVLIGAPTVAMMFLIAWGMIWRSPRAAGGGSRFHHSSVQGLIAVGWAVSLLFCGITLSPVINFHISPAMAVAGVLALTGLLIWFLVHTMSEDGSGTDNTPDSAWKWGMIYYNPADPAFVVQRRFGIGYTVNFANRMAWAPAAMFVLILVMTAVVVRGS